MTTPQPKKTGGILAINPTQAAAGDARRRARMRFEGEKVVIRRLPPGMLQEEFVAILGSEWMSGEGKVGWFSYRVGKVSHE